MNARLDWPPARTDPALRVLLVVAALVAVVGVALLLRAALESSVGHVTLRVDNQTNLPLTVDALDAAGSRLTIATATPKAQATIQEVVDLGDQWTFVATYAGREVHRQTLSKAELRAQGWTVTIPADATRELEQAEFQ